MKILGIFGSSGLAREVADIALENGYENIFFIDFDSSKERITGFNIVAENELSSMVVNNDFHFIIGIGEGSLRRKIVTKFSGLKYVNIIHPAATIGYKQEVILESSKGNIFFAGARFTHNIKIGDFCLFNSNITIGHDCIIEDFVTVSPGANISGNVKLSEGCYIGTGSTILQCQSLQPKWIVGKDSIVGAGAVVVKNVIPETIVKGIPAK